MRVAAGIGLVDWSRVARDARGGGRIGAASIGTHGGFPRVGAVPTIRRASSRGAVWAGKERTASKRSVGWSSSAPARFRPVSRHGAGLGGGQRTLSHAIRRLVELGAG